MRESRRDDASDDSHRLGSKTRPRYQRAYERALGWRQRRLTSTCIERIIAKREEARAHAAAVNKT